MAAIIPAVLILPTVPAMKVVAVARVKPTFIASKILVRPTLTVDGLEVVVVPAFYWKTENVLQTASVLNVVRILTVEEMNNVAMVGAQLVRPAVQDVGSLVILTRIAEALTCTTDVVTERARRVIIYALIKRPGFFV